MYLEKVILSVKNGRIPWHCSEDLKWFKKMTMGQVVIMGRKTYQTIGHGLPDRYNIILSKSEFKCNFDEDVAFYCSSLERAIEIAKEEFDHEEIFIIGGASIYDYAMEHNLVDNVYIDYIAEDVEDADTFFNLKGEWFDESHETILSGKAEAVKLCKLKGLNTNEVDSQYLSLVSEIIKNGELKDTRSGKVYSLFGKQMRFNLKNGLPILTTKKMFSKGVIHELLWFIKGDTNIKYLVENGVNIWTDDAYRHYCSLVDKNNEALHDDDKIYTLRKVSKEEFIHKVISQDKILVRTNKAYKVMSYSPNQYEFFYTFGDLGPVYGYQWNYNGQLKDVIERLKTNPDDRRLIVSAWNVKDIDNMALPPCHYSYQFYTRYMSHDERVSWYNEHIDTGNKEDVPDGILNVRNVPTRKLSCMFNQRSCDFGLGIPFNLLSYSLLTHMVAQCVNMDVDELIFNGGDCHVYENHIPMLKEQLERNPYKFALPKLELNEAINDLFAFEFEDIEIVGYESYPTIKMPLSVG